MYVKIRDVMIKDPIVLPDTATVGDAVKAFVEHKVGGFPLIQNDGTLTAYLTDGDLIHYILKNVRKANRRLTDVRAWYQVDCFPQYIETVVKHEAFNCATHRVHTLDVDMDVREAAEVMDRRNLKHAPVVDENDKVVGLLSRSALVQGIFEDYLSDQWCIEEEVAE